jgi:hypothetical protein
MFPHKKSVNNTSRKDGRRRSRHRWENVIEMYLGK